MFQDDVQAVDADEAGEVADDWFVRLDVQFLDGVDGLGGGHVVRVVGGHSYKV